MNIASLLDEINDTLTTREVDIPPHALENIRKIQTICNQKYFDRIYYGAASLNRMILLDADIAELLTPDTILAIFTIHNKTKKLDKKSNIAVWRNSKGYISLAAILYYGFSEGLERIKLLPNNEPDYNEQKYNIQKQNFENNTLKIVRNIHQLAQKIHINVSKYDFEERQVHCLDLVINDLNIILATLNHVKNNNKRDRLLEVATYTTADIDSQASSAFINLFSALMRSTPPVENFGDAAKKMISSANLFSGKNIHFIFDRVHLESLLASDDEFGFGFNPKFKFQSLFRKMITESFNDQTPAGELAREQLLLRISLLKDDLSSRFPIEHKAAQAEVVVQTSDLSIDSMPAGFRELQAMRSELENELKECKWACKDTSQLTTLKDFLKRIIEEYETQPRILLKEYPIEGYQIPPRKLLTECLDIARKDIPEGEKLAKSKYGERFIKSILADFAEEEQNIEAGPRLKNKATQELENLVHLLLTKPLNSWARYNALDEMELFVNGICYNLTQLLKNQPDFEQIILTDEQLDGYLKSKNKSEGELHEAEQTAIKIYARDSNEIQDFLRNFAVNSEHKNLKNNSRYLGSTVIKTLLTICIASHGLSQHQSYKITPNVSAADYRITHRKEKGNSQVAFFKDRLNNAKAKVIQRETGFVSTSQTDYFAPGFKLNMFTIFPEHAPMLGSSLGKDIEQYAVYKMEKEVLFAPGTQFQYTGYVQEGSNHYFAAKPVRSLNGIIPDEYTLKNKAFHELKIIEAELDIHLKKNKHHFVRRLFDTVDNNKKINCIVEVKKVLVSILEDVEKNGDINSIELSRLKEKILNGMEKNAELVKNCTSIFGASLGKTEATLKSIYHRTMRALSYVEDANAQPSPKNSM